MVSIRSLASGSGGNCYQVDDGKAPLLLECGIRWKQIQKGVGFKTSRLAGCLVSHEHGDHSKSIKEILLAGIETYLSQGTAEVLGVESHHRVNIVQGEKEFNIGKDWKVMPIEVQHDAAEPLGFVLKSFNTGARILYATDTHYLKYNLSKMGLTHIMIEVNYSEQILQDRVLNGEITPEQKRRIIKTHFSLEGAKEFLRTNDLSKLREIWLLHLSAGNSDEKMFKQEIQGIVGRPVYVTKERG